MIKKKIHLFILLFLFNAKIHTLKLQNYIEITIGHEKSKEFLDRILPDTLLEKKQKETYEILQKFNSKADNLIALHIAKITSQDVSDLTTLKDTIKNSKSIFSYRFNNNYFDSNDVNLLHACTFSLTFINTLLQKISDAQATCNKNN